jgi:hypothetical protein
MQSAPSTGSARPIASSSSPASPRTARPPERDKIVFNCPACGHGYRLAAKLAGKQGRCTACRGVFTIPFHSPSPPPVATGPRPEPSTRERAPRPAPARSKSSVPIAPGSGPPPGRRPEHGIVTAVPIPDDEDEDSDWWELDSSESIPATMARSGRGAAASLASVAAPAARSGRGLVGTPGPPAATAKPQRSQWETYAAVSAGGIVAAIVFAICFFVLSDALSPQQKSVAVQPKSEANAPPAPVAEVSQPKPDTGSSTIMNGPQAHRAVIDDLIRAYNDIADGYAQISDATSIFRSEGRIARGVDQLRAAALRGRSLPPLPPDELAVLTGSKGPALLQAVDRVIQQLRRLKATPGIKSDFDRLIDAYTRARQEIEREIQSSGNGPSQRPNFDRPPAPNFPRIAPPAPPRRLRGRR